MSGVGLMRRNGCMAPDRLGQATPSAGVGQVALGFVQAAPCIGQRCNLRQAPHLGLLQQPGDEDRAAAIAALNLLGIAELAALRRTRIRALSLGLRQRVAIAGTLLCRPRVLLFDEPLNGLDVPGVLWFRGLLRELAADGATVVIATHLLAEVVLTAGRVAILQRGRLRIDGPLADLVPADADAREWLESTLMECA